MIHTQRPSVSGVTTQCCDCPTRTLRNRLLARVPRRLRSIRHDITDCCIPIEALSSPSGLHIASFPRLD